MKKTIKIISIFLILVFAFEIVVQAGFGVNEITQKAINDANGGSDSEKKVVSIGNKILSIIRLIGIVLSVIMLMIIGIIYMLGSAEEKSQYKQTLIPYIMGAFFVFAASVIPQIIYEFFTGKK